MAARIGTDLIARGVRPLGSVDMVPDMFFEAQCRRPSGFRRDRGYPSLLESEMSPCTPYKLIVLNPFQGRIAASFIGFPRSWNLLVGP